MPAIGVLLAALCTSGAALAEPTANEKDTARQLNLKAREATAKGRYPEAVELYRAAHGIMHLPTTALNLAKALDTIGRLVEARDHAMEAIRIPPQPGEAPGQPAARKEAETLAATLTDRVPMLQLAVQGPPPDQVEIVINDAPSPGGLAVGRRLDPGAYVVELRAPGWTSAKRSIVLAERDRRSETFVLAPAPADRAAPPPIVPSAAPAPPYAPPPIGQDATADRTGPIVLTIVGASLGVAGIAVGAGTGVASLSQTSDLQDQCPGGACTPDLQDELDGAETLANVSNVGFAVGAAGAVLAASGVIWLVTTSDEEAPDRVTARLRLFPGFICFSVATP